MIVYRDERYDFYEIFNDNNGTLIRSDDSDGKDPIMRSYPELIDVGIMGHCEHGDWCKCAGVDCYQKAESKLNSHMSVSDFESIARQSAGKTFQFALGGAGDPNKHPEIESILRICHDYGIIPNMTISGENLTHEEIQLVKEYCGAIAVSWYSRIRDDFEENQKTIDAISNLIFAGCITNIHYVVSSETIKEAIIRLRENRFPKGVNAVIFILYKPIGNGKSEKTLRYNNPYIDSFLNLAIQRHPFRVGFDTCFTSLLVRKANTISMESIDACEAATFSMYIDSNLNCYPCSFGIWKCNSESCRDKSIREIWEGELFSRYRMIKEPCGSCSYYQFCRGGCKLNLGIELCEKYEQSKKQFLND